MARGGSTGKANSGSLWLFGKSENKQDVCMFEVTDLAPSWVA